MNVVFVNNKMYVKCISFIASFNLKKDANEPNETPITFHGIKGSFSFDFRISVFVYWNSKENRLELWKKSSYGDELRFTIYNLDTLVYFFELMFYEFKLFKEDIDSLNSHSDENNSLLSLFEEKIV